MTRLLTFALNASKVKADQLLYLNDPLLINNELLSLLQTKVGFWSNYSFTDDEIRIVCDAFNLIVRNKGSRNGIVQATRLYVKSIGLSSGFDIFIQNKNLNGEYIYKIEIGINSYWHDYTLLKEILRYILPTGYILNIFFYDVIQDYRNKKLGFFDKSLLYSDTVLISSGTTYDISKIRNQYYSTQTNQWKTLGAKIIGINQLYLIEDNINNEFVPLSNVRFTANPDSLITVENNEAIFDDNIENIDVDNNSLLVYAVSSLADEYDGIQSIDMTRIYNGTNTGENNE